MALVQKAFSEIITFSRSSNATRIGPNGLVQYAPHNLLTYSEQFDNAAWSKSDTTVTANAIAAPNGTVTADKLNETATTAIHQLFSSISASAQAYTWSIYARASERTVFSLGFSGTTARYAWFDLSSGTLVSATNCTATITNVGNSWYRCTLTATAAAETTYPQIFLGTTASGYAPSYAGTAGSGIYIWGAQLSVGPLPLDYTPTTTAAVYGPRFDYDPVTLAARGLLVEEQRTNLLTYSEQFDNAAWIKSSTTVTANASAAPDGTVTADLVTWSGSSEIAQIIVATNGTLSFWAKGVAGQTLFVGIAGTSASTTITLSDSWQRYSLSFTGTSTYIYLGKYAGATVTSAYLWGAQLEAGSFATSYIPTLASTVTRSADVASVNTLSPWFNATEGTIFAEANAPAGSVNFPGIVAFAGAGYTTIQLFYTSSSTGAGFEVGNSTQQANISLTASAKPGYSKFAGVYRANDFAAVVNGGTVGSDISGTVPTVTAMKLGVLYNDVYQINGTIKRIAYYPRRLTDAELQALTA